MLNYNFRVGDRVCIENDAWGTLAKSSKGEWIWICCHGTYGYEQGEIYYVFYEDNIDNDIISIGSYDFTKPQKIEKIDMNSKWAEITFKATVVNKINELIDYINKSEEK